MPLGSSKDTPVLMERFSWNHLLTHTKRKVFLHRVVSPAGVAAVCSLPRPSTLGKQTSAPTKFIQFKFPFQWQIMKISNFFHLSPEPLSPPAFPSLLDTPLPCLTPALPSRGGGEVFVHAWPAWLLYFRWDKEQCNVCLLFLLV